MKDYLNAEERNQMMVIGSLIRSFDNCKGTKSDAPKIITIAEQWDQRGNITTDERKSLKMASTYLHKFWKSTYDRMGNKEQEVLKKKLSSYDFRLMDDYTFQRICTDMGDKVNFVAVEREHFGKWCEEIMCANCKDCMKHWSDCELHNVLNDNLIPDSTWSLDNCRYAYKDIKEEIV